MIHTRIILINFFFLLTQVMQQLSPGIVISMAAILVDSMPEMQTVHMATQALVLIISPVIAVVHQSLCNVEKVKVLWSSCAYNITLSLFYPTPFLSLSLFFLLPPLFSLPYSLPLSLPFFLSLLFLSSIFLHFLPL